MSIIYDHSLGQVWCRSGGRTNGIDAALRNAAWMPAEHRLRAERMRQARMLFEGKHREYFLDEGRTVNNFPPIKAGQPDYFVPLNLLTLVAQKMADLLVGEPATFATDDSQLQIKIDAILKRSWIHATLQGAVVECCWAGDTYLEITRVAGGAMIGHAPANEVFPLGVQLPNQQYNRYVRYSVTAVPDGTNQPQHVMLETTYAAGSIERKCYLLKQFGAEMQRGDPVDLDRWPTRGADGGPLPEKESTGLNVPSLVYIPNGNGAVSDFDGLIEPQDTLHSKHTQISRVLGKHSDPKMYADETSVGPDGNLPAGGEVFFRKPGEEPPGYIVWDARVEPAMDDRKFAMLAFCIIAEMPPSLLGIKDDAVAETAAKMRLNASSALAKAARKATYWQEGLSLAISLAAEVETGSAPQTAIGVTLSDGLPTDILELSEIIASQRSAQTMSKRRALKMQMMSDAQVETELAELEKEAKQETPDVLFGEPGIAGQDANDPIAA